MSSSSSSPVPSDDSPSARRWRIAGVVGAYFAISISLVFVNKVLMDKRYNVDAPLFMTWYQCLVTVCICYALGEYGSASPAGSYFRQFPRFAYSPALARQLLPLTCVFVGMITFNNLCLQYVEVSFYNVARSLTIVFNVALTYWLLGASTSPATLACLAAVMAGFFVGSEGEVNFSMVGTLFGVSSSLFVALNGIMTKSGMELVDRNEWSLCAYNNMNAVLLFLPIIAASGELSVLWRSAAMLASLRYWLLMTLGGVFGFLIGIVTILQIKVTSPLTHNISGTAKACVQTVLALIIWRNPTNFTNMLGVAMVLAGTLAYSYVRSREMDAADAAKRAAKAAGAAAAAAGEKAEAVAAAAAVDAADKLAVAEAGALAPAGK